MRKRRKIALVGNPNTGKTSLFNKLTGLHKKIGNYPGITVNRVAGNFTLDDGTEIELIDLPGTYSLHPTSQDEEVVLRELLVNDEGIEGVIVVADVSNLKKNLMLLTQLQDLGYPLLLAINMCDEMKRKGIEIDVEAMEEYLGIPVVLVSAKKGKPHGQGSVDRLKDRIPGMFDAPSRKYFENFDLPPGDSFSPRSAKKGALYKEWLYYTEQSRIGTPEQRKNPGYGQYSEPEVKRFLQKEIIKRYQVIRELLDKTYRIDRANATGFTERIDRILLHKVWGLIVFAFVMFAVFQAIFTWSSYPMERIDEFFIYISSVLENRLPAGSLTDLLIKGIIPGISGVLMFVPQIAVLFFFISLLEELGYMSRIVFLMDRLMRPFGINGKSVVPLLSGTACAVPAIMSAATIENRKERLITMLVTPFITCSARLPVYTIIIALVIPEGEVFGFVNRQGLVLFIFYFLGFSAALISAFILSKIIKNPYKSYFILEMPEYKLPILRNMGINIWDHVNSFVFGAGKIIVAFSIILWFLASHGPDFNEPGASAGQTEFRQNENSGQHIEHSYLGLMGKSIEPVIRPLGYDWKIGVALISSFAAREVFVSTLSTIYSVEDGSERGLLKDRMLREKDPVTGARIFNLATGISLLVFYAFAMQCFSTLATLYHQTRSWRWPLGVFFYMTGMAYVLSLISYQFFQS